MQGNPNTPTITPTISYRTPIYVVPSECEGPGAGSPVVRPEPVEEPALYVKLNLSNSAVGIAMPTALANAK